MKVFPSENDIWEIFIEQERRKTEEAFNYVVFYKQATVTAREGSWSRLPMEMKGV